MRLFTLSRIAAFESFDAKAFAALCKGRDAGRGTRDADN